MNPFHLWRDNFEIFELSEVVRQKDNDFATLLNRVRVGITSEKDTEVLQARVISEEDSNYPHDALHVFTTNALVNDHNMKMIVTLDSQPMTFHAFDSTKDLNTKIASVSNIPDEASLTGGLATVTLAVGAKVMLTKNLDVTDGLVNGVQGTVVGFYHKNDDTRELILHVLVKFVSDSTGYLYRQTPMQDTWSCSHIS